MKMSRLTPCKPPKYYSSACVNWTGKHLFFAAAGAGWWASQPPPMGRIFQWQRLYRQEAWRLFRSVRTGRWRADLSIFYSLRADKPAFWIQGPHRGLSNSRNLICSSTHEPSPRYWPRFCYSQDECAKKLPKKHWCINLRYLKAFVWASLSGQAQLNFSKKCVHYGCFMVPGETSTAQVLSQKISAPQVFKPDNWNEKK